MATETKTKTKKQKQKKKQKTTLPAATWKGLAVLLPLPPGTRVGIQPGGSVEVDGIRPSSFRGHSGSAHKVLSSGSLLTALLARSRGQSARRADPIPGSLCLFPGPNARLGGQPAEAEWGGGASTCAEAQKRSRPPGLIPAYVSTLGLCFPTRPNDAKGMERTGRGGGVGGNS